MAYQFVNQAEGKVTITDEQDNTFTLKQINSISNDSLAASSLMSGLATMLDIVGWNVQSCVRVVNQNIEEVE